MRREIWKQIPKIPFLLITFYLSIRCSEDNVILTVRFVFSLGESTIDYGVSKMSISKWLVVWNDDKYSSRTKMVMNMRFFRKSAFLSCKLWCLSGTEEFRSTLTLGPNFRLFYFDNGSRWMKLFLNDSFGASIQLIFQKNVEIQCWLYVY